jgi:hypothetical protein
VTTEEALMTMASDRMDELRKENATLHRIVNDMRREYRLHGQITDSSSEYCHTFPKKATFHD